MSKSRFLLLALLSTATPALAQTPPANQTNTASTATTEVKKEAPTRFYGFAFDYSFWDGSALNGPNYSNSFSQLFLPAWNFGKVWLKGTRFERAALGARFVLDRMFVGYDETQVNPNSDHGPAQPCSDLTPSGNGGKVDPSQVRRCQYSNDYRFHASDITLTLRSPKIVTIPKAEININPGLSLIIPTSIEARYQTMRAAPGVTVGANRSFFDGKLTVGYSFWFTKYFHESTQPVVQSNAAAGDLDAQRIVAGYDTANLSVGDFYANPDKLAYTGGFNPNYSFRHTFSVDVLPTDKLSISVLYILIDSFKYGVSCDILVNGQPYDVCAAGDAVAANSGTNVLRTGHKDDQVFWLTVGYDVLDWLNVNVAWITWTSQRKPDGTLRQPFISTDYNAFTSISLGATISLDKAAAKLF